MSDNNLSDNNWWESDWYKEYKSLSKKRKRDFSFPDGKWVCYTDDKGELQYKYIKWKEI